MATIEERIAALQAKLKQEKARKAKIEARKKSLESKEQRALDTRKKILVGAFMLDRMARNEETKAKVLGQLDQYLTRADDRELFGLPAMAPTEA
ncbi:MAG: mobilization protein [Rhodoferax sp.]|nr:mobilization protein [Rhodoferax sp.]